MSLAANSVCVPMLACLIGVTIFVSACTEVAANGRTVETVAQPAKETTNDMEHDADSSDRRFENVPLGTSIESPCSPEIDPFDTEFRGLKVAAVSRITSPSQSAGEIAPDTSVPVCISGQLTLREVNTLGDVAAATSLELTDKASGKTLSGSLASPRLRGPVPNAGIPDSELDERMDRFFFNVNASEVLAIPAGPAAYELVVRVGDHVSNSVAIIVE